MDSRSVQTRVLWGIDPTSTLGDSQMQMLHFLKAVLKFRSTVVEPVYVMSPDRVRLGAELFATEGLDYRGAMLQRLDQMCTKLAWNDLISPTLLVADHVGLRSSVTALIEYAEQVGAKHIAVTSHARKGIGRFLLGSFAELLVTHSSIPVLLFNPKTRSPLKISRILFAFDFTKESETALAETAAFAREAKAELILFHQLAISVPASAEMQGLWKIPDSLIRAERKTREAQGEKWVQELKTLGIKARFSVSEKLQPIPEAILQAAKTHKANLISVASKSSNLTANLAGSVCRQICRHSTVPVWVVHPSKRR